VVDSLGELFYLYALGDLALVGGTFAKGVGGHNLLEPAYYRKFVLFGPYTHKVKDLEEFILSKNLGFNVASPQEAVAVAKGFWREGLPIQTLTCKILQSRLKNATFQTYIKY
jgi:3-deoxy-D-manno-octulosonic-acid transferase